MLRENDEKKRSPDEPADAKTHLIAGEVPGGSEQA